MQSRANIWLAEQSALKGQRSLMFNCRRSVKPALCCTLPIKALSLARLLWVAQLSPQLQAVPYAWQTAASTALLTHSCLFYQTTFSSKFLYFACESMYMRVHVCVCALTCMYICVSACRNRRLIFGIFPPS